MQLQENRTEIDNGLNFSFIVPQTRCWSFQVRKHTAIYTLGFAWSSWRCQFRPVPRLFWSWFLRTLHHIKTQKSSFQGQINGGISLKMCNPNPSHGSSFSCSCISYLNYISIYAGRGWIPQPVLVSQNWLDTVAPVIPWLFKLMHCIHSYFVFIYLCYPDPNPVLHIYIYTHKNECTKYLFNAHVVGGCHGWWPRHDVTTQTMGFRIGNGPRTLPLQSVELLERILAIITIKLI